MKPRCWSCGHYKEEHAEGVGACECVVIWRGAEERCFCTGFELMTIEKCAEWMARRQKVHFPDQTDHIISFLLEEAKRCAA